MDRRRSIFAYLLATAGLTAVTLVLLRTGQFGLQNAVPIYLLCSVLIGAIGGRGPAIVATIISLISLDWYFTPPFHQIQISNADDVTTLIVFIVTAAVVSMIVEQSKRRASEAERARNDADDAEALAKSNEMRAALLSAVSHDLRTPLASIKTAATTILDSDNQIRSKSEKHLLQTIDRSVDKLDAMVTNLLDASRVRTGAIEVNPSEVSIAELVTELFDELPNAPLRVVLELPETLPLVWVDPILLSRALINVTANALAFSTADVTIRASESEGYVRIEIVDHGPGIDLASRDRALLPFQRLGDTSNDRHVGLGLSIANGFVLAVGGSLTIGDTPLGGTTIAIDVPVSS